MNNAIRPLFGLLTKLKGRMQTLVCLLFALSFQGHAQSLINGIKGITLPCISGPGSAWFNPSATSNTDSTRFISLFQTSNFNEKALQSNYLFAGTPLPKRLNLQFALAQSGIPNILQEQVLKTGLSKSIHQNITVGVQFIYGQLSDAENNRKIEACGAASLSYLSKTNLKLSFILQYSSSINKSFQFAGYKKVSSKVALHQTLRLENNTINEAGLYMQYQPFNLLEIRTGVNLKPISYLLCTGFKLKNFSIQLFTSTHSNLGLSWGCGITYSYSSHSAVYKP